MEIYLNNRKAVFFTLSLVILSLLYSSTLHAPFNFDDEVVVKLEARQHVESLNDPTLTSAGRTLISIYPLRYRHLFYSSLVLNYSLGELNPFGYHLVNTSFIYFDRYFFYRFYHYKKWALIKQKRCSFNCKHNNTIFFI